jgi:hypothetical protein
MAPPGHGGAREFYYSSLIRRVGDPSGAAALIAHRNGESKDMISQFESDLNSAFIHCLPMAKRTTTPKKSKGTPITIAGTGPIPVTKREMKITKKLPKTKS